MLNNTAAVRFRLTLNHCRRSLTYTFLSRTLFFPVLRFFDFRLTDLWPVLLSSRKVLDVKDPLAPFYKSLTLTLSRLKSLSRALLPVVSEISCGKSRTERKTRYREILLCQVSSHSNQVFSFYRANIHTTPTYTHTHTHIVTK